MMTTSGGNSIADFGLRIADYDEATLPGVFLIMTRSAEEFQKRTRDFAVRVIKMVNQLSASRASDVIGKQILRSATSVGANYRAACRARSPAEFRAKLGIVEEEGDECCYWLELLGEAEIVSKHLLVELQKEANEITAMVVASIRTSKEQNKR